MSAARSVSRQRTPVRTLVVLTASLLGGLIPGASRSSGAEASSTGNTVAAIEVPAAGDPAWKPVLFPGVQAHSHYQAVEDGGRTVWKATSNCAASGLVVSLEGVDLERTPLLSWQWKLEIGPEPERERTRAGDDFGARVYVMFPFEPEEASLFARMRHRVAAGLYGVSLPGNTLNYVWTGHTQPPTHWRNPYAAENWMIATRSGRSPDWHQQTVDLRKDHERLIGPLRSAPLAIAIMADSDDSCGRAVSYFYGFRFHAAP